MFYPAAKQSFGLNNCEARSSEKHLLQALSIMLAYSIAEIYRYRSGLLIIEDVIRSIRELKIPLINLLLYRSGGNVC